MKRALLIIDMLNDFATEEGTLFVDGSREIIGTIQYLSKKFDIIFHACDQHEADDPEFETFPPHAVKGKMGSWIIDELSKIGQTIVPKVLFSAFSNDTFKSQLQEAGVEELVIVGVATEFCVKGAAIDAVKEGFKATVVLDAIEGCDINEGDIEKALTEMREAGVNLVDSTELWK